MKELQVFEYKDVKVRTVQKDGELWFVAKDVTEALGYYWQPNLVNHVPDEWKGINPINTPGGIQEMLCLSEQGLYFFLGRSDKAAALPFQKWIAGEVIPSVRKKGFYAVPGKNREEQDEWKKNFPYPFLLLDDAAARMREMRLAVDKGKMTVKEWRRIVLGDFGSYKPCSGIDDFIRENVTITGNPADYVIISDLYARYEMQGENDLSRHQLVRKIRTAFPALVRKQKKIDGYPVLVFCACKLSKDKLKGAVNAY